MRISQQRSTKLPQLSISSVPVDEIKEPARAAAKLAQDETGSPTSAAFALVEEVKSWVGVVFREEPASAGGTSAFSTDLEGHPLPRR